MRPKNPKPQFKIRLDKLVWETFKLECRRRGLKPNEVVENLIEIYLAHPIITTLFAKG
jgi:hypothetical protein